MAAVLSYPDAPRDWQAPVQKRLHRLANRAYKAQLKAHLRRGRSRRTFRFNPPGWQRDVVAALGRNDEAAAKAILLFEVP